MQQGFTSEEHPVGELATCAASQPSYLLKRAARREESLRQVEMTALTLFARDGFDAVTVDQICAEAQIATATFYRYFGSKDGVIFRYEEEFLAIARDIGASVDPKVPTVEQLRVILRRLSSFFEEQSEIRAMRDEIVLANPPLLKRTYAVERQFEDMLAQSLAVRREESEPSTGTLLDAALCLIVLRLSLIAWRYQGHSSLQSHVHDTYESARARLS